MREFFERHGLIPASAPPQVLEAANQKSKGSNFAVLPYGTGRYIPKKHKRSVRNLINLSEAPLPSRAIRLIRNGVTNLEFAIQPKDLVKARKQPEAYAAAADLVRSVVDNPNTEDDDFASLNGQTVEDLLIFDAGVWEYVEKPGNNPLNKILSLIAVPGFSIAKIKTWNGKPDSPRWAQIDGNGNVVAEFLDKELEYIMMRKRSFNPFGLSPLETALEVIDRLLALDSFQNRIASDNYPQNLIWLGEEATPEQIQSFRVYWENELAGRGRPGFYGGMGQKSPEVLDLKPANDDGLYPQYQEFQVRILALCFDLSPQDFGLERDINRSTAEVSQSRSLDESRRPYAEMLRKKYNRRVIPLVSEITGNPLVKEIELTWVGLDPEDKKLDAEVDQIYLSSDTFTLDEVRAGEDKDPLPNGLGRLTLSAYKAVIQENPYAMVGTKDIADMAKETEELMKKAQEEQANMPPGGDPNADPNNPNGSPDEFAAGAYDDDDEFELDDDDEEVAEAGAVPFDVEGYGTSEGAKKGWDTRGRGRKKRVGQQHFNFPVQTEKGLKGKPFPFNRGYVGPRGAAAVTKQERWSMGRYQGNGYRGINGCARQIEGCSESSKKDIKNLDSAFRKAAFTKYEMTVYRGVNDITKLKVGNPTNLVGKYIHDKGFVSTSVDEKKASGFASSGRAPVIFRIQLPKGTRAFNVHKVTRDNDYKAEKEILLSRGTFFKITGVRKEVKTTYGDKQVRWVVDARALRRTKFDPVNKLQDKWAD